jgi:hypothetical protein
MCNGLSSCKGGLRATEDYLDLRIDFLAAAGKAQQKVIAVAHGREAHDLGVLAHDGLGDIHKTGVGPEAIYVYDPHFKPLLAHYRGQGKKAQGHTRGRVPLIAQKGN